MKAWLKGGLIGIGVVFISFLFIWLFKPDFGFILLLIFLLPVTLLLSSIFYDRFGISIDPPPGAPDPPTIVNFILIASYILWGLLVGFVVGALVGWILEKIKSKNQENSSPI